MKINPEHIKTAQRYVQLQKVYAGMIDGIAGPVTLLALQTLGGLPMNWSVERRLVACIQKYSLQSGFDPGKVDGLWGPKTQSAYAQLTELLYFSTAPAPAANLQRWPLQTQAELNRFYGLAVPQDNPQLVSYTVPYPLKIAWDLSQSTNQITTHEKVKESVLRVLTRTLEHYGIEAIERLHLNRYGGCFNYRKTRNGNTLSTHAWGIALDFDPERNQLKWGKDRAAFARPEYESWWSFWEAEGWVSLGRSRNYDWMHVQAARLTA